MAGQSREIDSNLGWLKAGALLALIWSVVVILWGAVVRATGSGAGCGSHWPLCNGEVLPTFERFHTLVEFTHRISSGVSLIAVILVGVLSWRKSAALRKPAILTIVAIVLEALIGAFLVLGGLVELDRSVMRAISICLHLINTCFLVGAQVYLYFAIRQLPAAAGGNLRAQVLPTLPTERKRVVAISLTFVALGILGALSALGDTLFRPTSLAEGWASDFSETAHWLERIRILHPFLAVIWAAMVFVWIYERPTAQGAIRKIFEAGAILNTHPGSTELTLAENPSYDRSRRVLLIAVGLNLLVGVTNIVTLAPVPVQIGHLFMANVIWISWVWTVLELANPRAAQQG